MDKKGLTITFIVKGLSLNYDEGYGNVSILKKVHRGGGDVYVYASRQSLRYSIVKYASENLGWRLTDLSSRTKTEEETATEGAEEGGKSKVVQIDISKLSQNNYPEEADLFGYMATGGKRKAATSRPAVARLTHLVSLEPSFGDIELLTNKWFADRANAEINMANIEQCLAFYKFTLAVDLDRVGEDEIGNLKISLKPEEKAKRVQDLLECLKHLYRDIRARREDLKPLFAIGGLYHIKSPFFHNGIEIEWKGGKPAIRKEAIEQILNSEYTYSSDGKEATTEKIKNHTKVGIRKSIFTNETDIRSLFNDQDLSPEEMLDSLKKEVKAVYGVKN